MKKKIVNQTPPILKFDDADRYLSNFWISGFHWKDKWWPTSEHAYQAMKAIDEFDRERIRNLPEPRDAKKAGKTVKMRKDEVMEEVVFAKFDQNKDLKEKLLATGDAHLEEGNTWKDVYWGVCPPGSGNGQNKLGVILMKVRDRLRN